METIYKEKIDIVHHKNSQWKNQLALYEEELNLFKKRLAELSHKNVEKKINPQFEQFQNKFIIQQDKIDELKHDINVIEDNAIYSAKSHIRRISYKRTAKFIYVKNSMKQFELLFKELKDEFYSFLAKKAF